MPAATSPKNSPCLYCGKLLTARGVVEHERHHCNKNPKRVKRNFEKKICKVCGKRFHGAALRAHMATQHPLEFAKAEARRPSSRAAKRREIYERAKESVRAAAVRGSSARDATEQRSSSGRRQAAPVDTTALPAKVAPRSAHGRRCNRRCQELPHRSQEMRCTGGRLSHPTARPVECIGAPLRKASLGGESLVQPLLLGTATMSWRGHQRKRQKWLLQAINLITPHCPTG